MTREGSGANLGRSEASPWEWRLETGPDGRFELSGRTTAVGIPDRGGWTLGETSFGTGARLERSPAGRCWTLLDARTRDRGCVAQSSGASIGEDPPAITWSDGRVYRIACRGAGYAVRGREAGGEVLEIEPSGDGEWRLTAPVAGRGLEGMDGWVVLVAAMIASDGAAGGHAGDEREDR